MRFLCVIKSVHNVNDIIYRSLRNLDKFLCPTTKYTETGFAGYGRRLGRLERLEKVSFRPFSHDHDAVKRSRRSATLPVIHAKPVQTPRAEAARVLRAPSVFSSNSIIPSRHYRLYAGPSSDSMPFQIPHDYRSEAKSHIHSIFYPYS